MADVVRSTNRKDAALAPAIRVLTPAATAGCLGAGGAPRARNRPPNAGCRRGGILSRPGRRPSRPTGPRANPILQESLWTWQWPEWSWSPGGHGENKVEDSLGGAGRFRKALRPGHCPLDRERTAARSNSSGRGGRSGTLRERSALLGPLGPGSTAGDFCCAAWLHRIGVEMWGGFAFRSSW